MKFDKIRDDASGKWLSIWRALGISVNETGRHGPCPVCAGKDRFRVDKNVAEKGSYFCSGCGPGFGFDLIMKVMNIGIKEAMDEVCKIVGSCEKNPVIREEKVTPEYLRKIFITSSPIKPGDPAHRYLTNRGIKKISPTLRHSGKCWNADLQKNVNALLAVFTLPCGKAVTMQRIYLTPEGDKLDCKTPKKHMEVLPEGMKGGAVRLWPVEGKILGVAEGVGTALAASEDTGIPVWATLSTSLMACFSPPKEIEELVIFADYDKHYAGHKAAYALAHNMVMTRGLSVKVCVPEVVGWDWLDVLNNQNKNR